MKIVTMPEFLAAYCETQDATIETVTDSLNRVKRTYPDLTHFVIYQCADMSSSQLGNKVIMPIGPSNTFKSVDTLPKLWSPRGLASDMSTPEYVTAA